MPYPSSHTEMTSGICSTPTALRLSQNTPSLVPAFPIVAKHTSSPFREKPRETARAAGDSRYSFDAHARPTDRGICAPTGESSDADWPVASGVELREVLRQIGQPDREHEGLVAVVAGPPVTRAEGVRHAELSDLLALARDAKGRVPDQDLAPRELTRRPAAHGEPVVGED